MAVDSRPQAVDISVGIRCLERIRFGKEERDKTQTLNIALAILTKAPPAAVRSLLSPPIARFFYILIFTTPYLSSPVRYLLPFPLNKMDQSQY